MTVLLALFGEIDEKVISDVHRKSWNKYLILKTEQALN